MTDKPRVWVSRPTFPGVIARLEPHFEVSAEEVERKLSPTELAARLAGQDAVIVGLKDRIGAAEVGAAERLRIVANLAVGYDNIDVDAMSAAGIAVSNTADVLNESVADFAWAMLLGAARRMTAAERWLRAGQWHATEFKAWLGTDVRGRTLGILGMGRIGQAIARRAVGFGMPVIYHNRSPLPEADERACNARHVDKQQLLGESDFLVLALPLTARTRHAIAAAELALMKPTAMLINVARGGIVDDAALIVALRAQRIAAAGLDVFENEPAFDPAFLDLSNVVLTPHIGSASAATRRAMADRAADNLIAALTGGSPPDLLNPRTQSKS